VIIISHMMICRHNRSTLWHSLAAFIDYFLG
jgi:hypothetical protein